MLAKSKLKSFLKNLFTTILLYCFVMTQSIFLFVATANDAKALTPTGNFVDVEGIVADGSTKTMTDRTASGVATVYIAPPTPGGVSNNHMRDFQNNENTIINNYKGVSTNSRLENGQVIGNPNYGSGVNEASIILMQVTGGNRTNMRAITEIVGRNAEYIIANPNGIDVAGASFINTSKLALVTGSANLDANGNLAKFDISNNAGSDIIITGVNNNGAINLGLDVSNVNYVDIVSRSIQVLGNVIGSSELSGQLNFKTGNHQYDYLTKNITSDSNKGNTTKPIFALDSSHLGGMYAGRINLIATESGLGVTTRGDLIADVADINFSAVGDIKYEAINASKGNINITSHNGNIKQGEFQDETHIAGITALGNINITATNGDVDLLGQGHNSWLVNGSKVSIFAGNNLSLTNSSIIARDENLSLEANQNIALKDQELYAGLKNISVTSNFGNIAINSDSGPSVVGSNLNNKIEAKVGSINIFGAKTAQIGGVNIDLIAKNILDLENLKIVARQNLTLTADNNINLKNHQLYADDGDVNITSFFGDVALKNGSLQSLIQANYDSNINAGGKLEIENSKIIAGDNIALTSNQNLTLENQELYALFGNITVTSNLGNIAASQSIIKADQDLKIDAKVGDVLTNGVTNSLLQGLNKTEILAGNNLDLENVSVQSLGNINLAASNNITLKDYDLYSAAGDIEAIATLGNVKLQSTFAANLSTIIADNGKVNISAGNDLEIQDSQISANQDLTLLGKRNIKIQDAEFYSILKNISITATLGNINIHSDLSSSILSSAQNSKIESRAGSVNISGAKTTQIGGVNIDLIAKNMLDFDNLMMIANQGLTLSADNNVTLKNHQLYADNGDLNITSLFGNIDLQAGLSQSIIQASHNVNIAANAGKLDIEKNKIIAGGNIDLVANQNLTLKNQELYAIFGNINLTSNIGNVAINSDLSQSIISANQDLIIESRV